MAKVSEKVKVYEIGIDELKPDPANANAGTVRGHKMIEDSVAQTGLHRGVAIDANGYLVAGNKTQQAAIDAGFKKAVVVETDGDTLVVTKRRDFNLMDDDPNNIARRAAFYDNRTSEIDLAWSAEQLLADLQSGVDLGSMFDQSELDALLAGLVEKEPVQDAGAQVDKAQELLEKWKVKPGDMFALGRHRLICGDCTDRATIERLMMGERADAVVTDPPYGVGVDYSDFDDTIENVKRLIDGFMPIALSMNAPIALTPGIPCMWYYPKPDWLMGWIHPAATSSGPWGFIGLNPILIYGSDPYLKAGKGRHHDHIVMAADREGVDGHPVTKPIKVWQWLIERMSVNESDVIYEPFSGSGTTIIACEQLSRQCRAVEISPAYVSVALERFYTATNKMPVLISSE